MNARVACAGSGPSSGSLAYEYWRVTWGSAGGSAYISTPASEAGLRGLQAAGLSSKLSKHTTPVSMSRRGCSEHGGLRRDVDEQGRASIMIRESQARREMSDESCVGASRIRRAYPTSRCPWPWTARLVLRVDVCPEALSSPSTLVCVVCQRAQSLSGHSDPSRPSLGSVQTSVIKKGWRI